MSRVDWAARVGAGGVGTLCATLACTVTPSGNELGGDGTVGVAPSGSTTDAPLGSTSGTDTGANADTSTSAPDEPIFDLGGVPDAPPPEVCVPIGREGKMPQGRVNPMIWISNSTQGTVSKIDTVTLEELGRYRTHPGAGDPSRTSVNLNGDVAVANRNGGVVKFYSDVANCVDLDGDGAIRTSTGPGDVLPWADEECRAWFAPLDYASQRPIAWTPGEWNAQECRYENAQVWTSGATDIGGESDTTGVDVVLIDGATGSVEATISVPEITPNGLGLYGGAVDGAGNFWASQLGSGDLLRVDFETLDYEVWPMLVDGYGMTVDSQGRVWTCSAAVARFDPATATWQSAAAGGSGGCMVDDAGVLWIAGEGLIGIDTETLDTIATHFLPEPVHGVSIDYQGYVWGVSIGTTAYRVDPSTGTFDTVSGLVGAYTYSDMTGFALANAGVPAG